VFRILVLTVLVAAPARGDRLQPGTPPGIARLLAEPAVRAALDAARANESAILDEQVRLCEIPAPPFGEEKRAAAYRSLFSSLGLKDVRIDGVGNVIGERPGAAARPNVVVSAHLDTVFPEETDVRVTRDGPLLRGPGIGDDCRGLAVIAGVVRALDRANLRTAGTLTFVGTVGEEGLGDLRGVKHLVKTELKNRIDAFLSIDGGGYGITRIAVGSLRYRVTFKGPGGNSYAAFGQANALHALGRAMAAIADLRVPPEPKTTFNVGRIGGGTSVNSIAEGGWMEVDMRSADVSALAALDASFHRAVDRALAEENTRWRGRGHLTVEKRLVGDRPAAAVAEHSPIVQTAVGVTRALGLPVSLEEGSTDANLPMSVGVPALTIAGGGRGIDSHSLGETFDATESWKGTQRAMLLVVALANDVR
jgi:acetylornithine deacetylase/succinyl-diaminopimelate desuccinylase-like protein